MHHRLQKSNFSEFKKRILDIYELCTDKQKGLKKIIERKNVKDLDVLYALSSKILAIKNQMRFEVLDKKDTQKYDELMDFRNQILEYTLKMDKREILLHWIYNCKNHGDIIIELTNILLGKITPDNQLSDFGTLDYETQELLVTIAKKVSEMN